LQANDGSNSAYLQGRPSGKLTWDGKAVTLSGDCLPLTGGKMTGTIVKSGAVKILSRDTDDNAIQIVGGTDSDYSAYLNLYGGKYSTASKGSFTLAAHDGTNLHRLIGKPDGTLTWSGKSFECVVASSFNSLDFYIQYASGLII
jgi:hypothetical protein